MPYTIFCSTADNSRTGVFMVESRDRVPSRTESEAMRLIIGPLYWSTQVVRYDLPQGMTLADLQSALCSVTGIEYELIYTKNKTLFVRYLKN